MDAGVNDNIYFEVKSLKSIKLTIGLGVDYSLASLNRQTYLFTESVNAGGGYVKYPYPFEGYIVTEYDPTAIPDDPSV